MPAYIDPTASTVFLVVSIVLAVCVVVAWCLWIALMVDSAGRGKGMHVRQGPAAVHRAFPHASCPWPYRHRHARPPRALLKERQRCRKPKGKSCRQGIPQESPFKHLPPNDPDTDQRPSRWHTHQDAKVEIPHIRPAGGPGHGAAGHAKDVEDEAVEDALPTLQLLRAAQQVEDLPVVVGPHAVLHRILVIHELRKRHVECAAELLNDAAVRHALAILPLGDRLV